MSPGHNSWQTLDDVAEWFWRYRLSEGGITSGAIYHSSFGDIFGPEFRFFGDQFGH